MTSKRTAASKHGQLPRAADCAKSFLKAGVGMQCDAKAARTTVTTPIGELLIAASGRGLSGIWFEGGWPKTNLPGPSHDEAALAIIQCVRAELDAYFDGKLRAFSVPCDFRGTEFQKGVWSALQDIPFGEVVSYAQIADRVGRPKAVRAVGAANGQNPIPIVIPCHRVIGSDGSLTGFGGGIERKRWLLEHEGALTRRIVA